MDGPPVAFGKKTHLSIRTHFGTASDELIELTMSLRFSADAAQRCLRLGRRGVVGHAAGAAAAGA
jgi:hypothetical protein